MIFLLKKDGSETTEISLENLVKKFEISSLKKKINALKIKAEESLKTPEINKKYILDLTGNNFLKKGELLDISNAASVEKIKSISEGTIYYNKTKGAVRLKIKTGWVTLKTE